jgi:hypothetical protein
MLVLDGHLPVLKRFGYRAIGRLLRALEPQLIKVATQ